MDESGKGKGVEGIPLNNQICTYCRYSSRSPTLYETVNGSGWGNLRLSMHIFNRDRTNSAVCSFVLSRF